MPLRTTENRCQPNYLQERLWTPSYLKNKCKELGLEAEFRMYKIRLFKSYLSVFYVMHLFLTLVHCTLLLTTCEYVQLIYPDLGIYVASTVLVFVILSVNFCDEFTGRHTWVMYISSVGAALTLALADLTHSMYHHLVNNWVVGSFYDTYITYAIYMFLPIHFFWGTVGLSLLISSLYIVYFTAYVSDTLISPILPHLLHDLGLNITHYLCLNMVGIFFRLMNDMVVRSSFLDRHEYVKEELWLRNARRQEIVLLDSIIPPQISKRLQMEVQERIVLSMKGNSSRAWSQFNRSMTIQLHPEVSILYADVVNYTHLTTTLTVEKLVNVLHELYGRFDRAADRFKVLRIKFLGDCYYCVAGLTDPDPDHADNCVALGLCMISHIQEVRDGHKLDVNMRIGVHSGSLFAGIIGDAKLQYDVWGEDVTIANILESTGLSGFVHISGATLVHLNSTDFIIEKGPEMANQHPVLRKHRIHTYIIKRFVASHDSKDSFDQEDNVSIMDTPSRLEFHIRTENEKLDKIFQDELHAEFIKMPVSSFNLKSFIPCHRNWKTQPDPSYNLVSPWLTFRDRNLERAYLKQRDFMFKYSMLLVWLISLCLIFTQAADHQRSICSHCVAVDIIVLFSITFLTFIAWYKKLCWWRKGIKDYSKFSCFMFWLLDKIEGSLSARICIYLFVTASNFFVLFVILWNCDQSMYMLRDIEDKLFRYEGDSELCFHPWVVTNMMALMICMAFTFTRIPFLVKMMVAFVECVAYLLVLFFHLEYVFHHSITTNPFFPAEYAHSMIILASLIIAYLKERQSEFASKVNFNWRQELIKKEADANLTNRSIIVLLHNILPTHVVELYINSLVKHELYYESYPMVSVMFAMLMNFQMDLRTLRILNEIITEFDVLHYKEHFVVEKIKVVGCTYMAACGLDLNFADATSNPMKANRLTFEEKEHEEVAFVMTLFALDMMRTLDSCNKSYEQLTSLRSFSKGLITIGISSGEVMAGIVGASQPHYDIWGNAVNMASRMQSTGIPGCIQVTQETAIILQDFGIQCNYRGLTYVKGRGKIPTYLVAITEDLHFVQMMSMRQTKHSQNGIFISMSPYALRDDQINFKSSRTSI